MTIHFNAKEFKEILKSFTKLSRYSSSNLAPITFAFEPFQVIMVTEHAFIISHPNVSIQPPVQSYTFNPEVLLDLSLTDGDVELYWENDTSPLYLKNNYLRTALRISVPMPEFDDIPDAMESVEVPYGLLHAVNKFLSIPFIFFSAKKELMPVWFKKNSAGNLEISASDGYSLARINTEIPVKLKNLDIKVPKYIMECLYSKGDLKDSTPTKFGVHGLKSLFSNKTTQIYSASMNDDVSDFETTLKGFKSNVSCDFIPKKLAEAIKPLVSMLPKKDKSGAILAVKFEDGNVSMSTTHKDIGDGRIDFVEGISNVYQEKSMKISTVNMSPQAFQEYTELLDLDQASMFADNRMVYYKGICNVGDICADIEYVFPTAL